MAASVAPQVWDAMLNGIEAVMLEMLSGAFPVFVSPMVSGAETVFTSSAPKSSVEAESDTTGEETTAPVASENKLVLPVGSVAVAVTRSPGERITGRSTLKGVTQVVVELREHKLIDRRAGEFAQPEPLRAEIRRQRRGTGISQHASDFLLQHGRLSQRPLFGVP